MVQHLTSPLVVLAVISHVMAAARGLQLAAAVPPPPPLAKTSEHLPLAQRAMDFLDASPDPFQAVQASIALLREHGFEELPDDGIPFRGRLVPGGKYYYTRHQSTLVAFGIGNRVQSDVPAGFKIIGGHTDSPNLRVKPRSKRSGSGCIQIGVECYGGGLWHTWFDRDLGLSGRVWVRVGNVVAPRLVRIDRALLRISNLAIHLQTAKEREAFVVNKEDHLSPILALEVEKALNGGDKDPPSSDDAEEEGGGDDGGTVAAEDAAAGTDADPSTATSTPATTKDGWTEHQEPALLQVLAHELGVPVESIADFELNLFDCQRATLGGAFGEFLHSSRLDNLASCFMAVTALAEHTSHGLLENDADVAMVVLYDHEEVGSASAVGAASPVLGEAVRRISAALHTGDAWVGDDLYRACARQSLVVSSDQAHAVHPNYASKHEKAHQPKMNQGMVVKRNSNQRYATTPATGLLVREVARRAGLLPPQEFMVRQDCGCGSTIGPVISAATGIRAVDVGCPQLSMHSIRETMGVCDLTNGLALFRAFFEHFREVDDAVQQ